MIAAHIAPPIPVIAAVKPSKPITVQTVPAQSTRDLTTAMSFLTAHLARISPPPPIPALRWGRIDLPRRQGLASRLRSELGEYAPQRADAR